MSWVNNIFLINITYFYSPTGPLNGILLIDVASDEANKAVSSGEQSGSTLRTVLII